MKTGIANLPLHSGSAPRWLFEKMVRLGKAITLAVVDEFSPLEFLRRLSDPYWFQSFGCILGFDWHSSGVTTTVCAALKVGLKGMEKDTGIFVAGGKGVTSRKTPAELERFGQNFSIDSLPLIYASKMSAKIDSAAVQDGYQLYHHSFFTTIDGKHWAVVQQGMNDQFEGIAMARRYHWLSDNLTTFVVEPHHAIACDTRVKTLNLTAKASISTQKTITMLATQRVDKTITQIEKLRELNLPSEHALTIKSLSQSSIKRALLSTYQAQPNQFAQVLATAGVGQKTLRALSLIAELIYGDRPSYEDPAKFSFAHGGKDGYPYPVDQETYEESIEILHTAIKKAKIGKREKIEVIRQLSWL